MGRKLMLSFAIAAVLGLAWAESAQAQVYFGFGGGRGGWYGGYGPYYGGYGGYSRWGYGPSYYGGWGYSRPFYSSYYGGWAPSYRYYSPGYSSFYYGSPYTMYYTQPSYPVVSSMTTDVPVTTSFYRGPATEPNTRAHLRIEVPVPDARVWLEGTATSQTGMDRRFISPPLEPGQLYVYTVRATWMDGQQEVSREKTVNVRAGEEAAVSFR